MRELLGPIGNGPRTDASKTEAAQVFINILGPQADLLHGDRWLVRAKMRLPG